MLKSYFPYEYLDNVDCLKEEVFPSYASYESTLKDGRNLLNIEFEDYENVLAQGKTIEECLDNLKIKQPPKTGPEKYRELQEIWIMQGFENISQNLAWYK